MISMDKPTLTMAQKIAEVASASEQRRTRHAPKAVTVVLSGDTLVIALDGALSPADVPILRSEVSERIRAGVRPSGPVPQAPVLGPQLLRELSRDNKKPRKEVTRE
jgi:hypothetical protein